MRWALACMEALLVCEKRRVRQVPAHRLLFCSTLEGKVSIVRQLEPELHIDGDPGTVRPPLPLGAQLAYNLACSGNQGRRFVRV